MKVAFFNTQDYERAYFQKEAQRFNHEIVFLEDALNESTAKIATNFACICAFVNDELDEPTLIQLSKGQTKLIALRSDGYNHVDLNACEKLGLQVVNVPDYSPYAIAEHAIALILALNRKIPRSHNRVRDGNFTINDLIGFDLYNKTVGIIGTGRIGSQMARIMIGFGCNVLAHDLNTHNFLTEMGVNYVSLDNLLSTADIISLHLPLTIKTHHLINANALAKMKNGVMIINTGRGGLIDTNALIYHLKNGHIGHAGLDVYEREQGLFFKDFSGKIMGDDILSRLMTFPNVLITSHHAFLTEEALTNIARSTLKNIDSFANGKKLINVLISEDSSALSNAPSP